MEKQETQQFAKFFIKDLKEKKSRYSDEKNILKDFRYLTSS